MATYPDWLREEFGGLIDALDLGDMQKRFLRSRWLDQVVWLEGKAAQAQRRYYRLRVTTVVGAVIVPALVSLQALGDTAGDVTQVAAIVISLVVAICAAIEQFFHFGERWQHYRSTVERLKSEGWLYFERSGDYARDGATPAALFPSFAARVEELLQAEVGVFVTEVTAERAKDASGEK
jgi:hypothetical protein